MSVGEAEIDEALALFGTRRIGEASPVDDSILNDNYHVLTPDGPRFLRFIQRKRSRDVVEGEHRAMRFAAEAGIPVLTPLPVPGGETIAEAGDRRVALFPFVESRTAVRGAITAGEAAALGGMQGRLHAVFRDYSDPVIDARPAGEIIWSAQASIAALHRVDAILSSHLYGVDDRHARRALRLQLLLLESGQGRPSSDFAHLPLQVDHGDYHERNVLFEPGSDRILAVIDWERVRRLPRAFQLVRAIDFMGLLRGGPLDEYLDAYGRETRLGESEARDAVEQWWHSVLHNTWIYTVVFEEGETRAARFLPETEGRLRQLSDESFRRRLGEQIARHTSS